MTSITDASGTVLYSWNARNQLVGISGPTVSANFVYDGIGRREKKTINGSLTEFLYDGVNPVQETSGATVLANMLTGFEIDEFLTRTDVALADDLAQDTFLRAYKNIRSFRGEARFSTWLYRIAYNCFREDARRRKEFIGINEEQLQSAYDPQVADPGLRHDLMHALSLLPLHERSAILLCCQNGLSHEEAARVLDIPLGTVKTNVLRGREKLKRTLAAWGPD